MLKRYDGDNEYGARRLREIKVELWHLRREKIKKKQELEDAFDEIAAVREDWYEFGLEHVTIRLWDGAEGTIVYRDVHGQDELFNFEHPGWFYAEHTWTHGSLLMAEGFLGVYKLAGLPFNLFKALKSSRCLDDLVVRNGFRFSPNYYERLWRTGRKAPSLVAREILEGTGGKGVADALKPGFFRYEYGGWEMIYNPVTKEVWHIQPIK